MTALPCTTLPRGALGFAVDFGALASRLRANLDRFLKIVRNCESHRAWADLNNGLVPVSPERLDGRPGRLAVQRCDVRSL